MFSVGLALATLYVRASGGFQEAPSGTLAKPCTGKREGCSSSTTCSAQESTLGQAWKGAGGDGGSEGVGAMGKLMWCQISSPSGHLARAWRAQLFFSTQKRVATCKPPL